MNPRNHRVMEFMKLYSENFPRLIKFYRNDRSFSYYPCNWSIIQDLVELGKRLSKDDHKTCGRKKNRRCIRAAYSRILRFDQIVQELYGIIVMQYCF